MIFIFYRHCQISLDFTKKTTSDRYQEIVHDRFNTGLRAQSLGAEAIHLNALRECISEYNILNTFFMIHL